MRVSAPGFNAFHKPVGENLDRFSLGDHLGHLREPVAGKAPHDLERRVSFADVRDLRPGHDEA